MGMGGSTYVSGASTLSSYYNPAGLGYMHRSEIAVSARNMPKSQAVVEGDIAGVHQLTTLNRVGTIGLTHGGIAIPLKSRNGTNGTVSIAYTTGGYDHEQRFGDFATTQNGNPAPGYQQNLSLRNDFVTLAYGRANSSQTFSWGAAAVYAINSQTSDISGAPAGNGNFSANSHGWGGLFGIQFMPNQNIDIGISYRTPITLKGDNSGPLLYDKIPGRLIAGVAYRRDMGGDNFLILGAQAQHFWEGSRGQFFDSPEQTTFGAGAEYDIAASGGYFPIRLGYNWLPASATDFGSSNALTWGAGYRAPNGTWGLDLNFDKPQHAPADYALDFIYRFGH